MLNNMWYINEDIYRFDFLLAFIAFFTWLRMFFNFRITETFGPMFRILQQMIIDLGKFLVIWSVILIMFTCVAILAFGELKTFYTFEDTLIFFLESALGQWDMDVYSGTNDHGESLELVN